MCADFETQKNGSEIEGLGYFQSRQTKEVHVHNILFYKGKQSLYSLNYLSRLINPAVMLY